MAASPAQQNRLLVTATVSFYLVAALAMVIANKWVLNTSSTPLFFLFVQLLIAVVLFLLSHVLGLLTLPFDFNLQLMRGLAPMATLNVVGLSLSNLTLKYVDASFYQIARGLILPFTVLTSFVLLSSRPSKLILLSCTVVTVGFMIGVFLDGVQVSMIGVAFGVASSAVTALHSVVIKKSLDLLEGNALHLGWYSNLLSAAMLSFVVLAVGEGPDVVHLLGGGADNVHAFITGSIVTGSFGFLMCIASLLSIKVTSPITHMISSAVRGVAVSFLGVWIFHDVITTGRASSIAIILLGSVMYTWIKHLESQQSRPASPKDTYERLPMEEVDVESEKKIDRDR